MMIDENVINLIKDIIDIDIKVNEKILKNKNIDLNKVDTDIIISETNDMISLAEKGNSLLDKFKKFVPKEELRELYYGLVYHLQREDYIKCHNIQKKINELIND